MPIPAGWLPWEQLPFLLALSAHTDDVFTWAAAPNISQWDDLSGNANHCTNASGSTQPKKDAGTDKPWVYSISNDFLNIPALTATPGEYSVIYGARTPPTDVTAYVFKASLGTIAVVQAAGAGFGYNYSVEVTTGSNPLSTDVVRSVIFKVGDATIRDAGADVLTGGAFVARTFGGSVNLLRNTTGGQNWNSRISCLLVADGVMAAEDVERCEFWIDQTFYSGSAGVPDPWAAAAAGGLAFCRQLNL